MHRLSHQPDSASDNPPNLKTCHHCRGTATAEPPYGWYSLSVHVPEWMGKNGQPYVWAGMWCSAACLAADMPVLADQERLAHEVYEPVPAVGGDR